MFENQKEHEWKQNEISQNKHKSIVKFQVSHKKFVFIKMRSFKSIFATVNAQHKKALEKRMQVSA